MFDFDTPMPTLKELPPRWELILAGWLLHILLFALVAFRCLQKRREPTSAVAWILLAWFLPAVGFVLYMLFGNYKVQAKGALKRRVDTRLTEALRTRGEETGVDMLYWHAVHRTQDAVPETPEGVELNRFMDGLLEDFPLLGGNRVDLLLTGGEAYPPMLDAIRRARHHIHLQSFIIRDDATGRQFLEALAERARAGVEVRVLYDRFGSTGAVLRGFFRGYRGVPNLRLAGWTQANLLKRQFAINLRNHRKLLIVDGIHAFTGGINLHDENLPQDGRPAIRDYHFDVRGPVVQELQFAFLQDWHYITREPARRLLRQAFFPEAVHAGSTPVRVVAGGPSDDTEVLGDIYFTCISTARRQLWAVSPYFAPTAALLHALRAAALRGVDVRLVFPGRNNHVYAGLAGRAHYEELLTSGVRIFERNPPFMHAKALVVDNTLALVGTANLDVRSLRLNYETNLAVFDGAFVATMKDAIREELAESLEITLADWRRRPYHQQVLENACNLFTPIL